MATTTTLATSTPTMTLTTSKGRSVVTTFTNQEAYTICKSIPKDFARSLTTRPLPNMSADQITWLHILAVEHSTPRVPARQVELSNDLGGLFSMLETASARLKYPKVRILAGDTEITLKASSGKVYIEDANEEVFNTYRQAYAKKYYGKVDSGVFYPTSGCPDTIVEALKALALNPLEQAQRYGRLTGRCSFCGRLLTDAVSVENGYGPVCATKYGLA